MHHVRLGSLDVEAALHPPCGRPATTLYTLGCADPAVRQRVRFTAPYVLASDDGSYALSGLVNLSHADAAVSLNNLDSVAGPEVFEGSSAGSARFELTVVGTTVARDLFISFGLKKIIHGPNAWVSECFFQRRIQCVVPAQKTPLEQSRGNGDIRPALANAGFDVANAMPNFDIEVE